ncbi:MAG: TSUP family transporter [Cyanobacteria bacterium REEB67]|nr:TSUP family transporter [Cyanobacteria bacterium REEB67]
MTIGFLLLGLVAGALSGLVGVGGGIIIVPALVYFFGFSQHNAQGTTLALMVPPIGLLAAWTYYKNNMINFNAAGIICIGFLIGSVIGSRTAISISDQSLQRCFASLLLIVSIKMLFFDKT